MKLLKEEEAGVMAGVTRIGFKRRWISSSNRNAVQVAGLTPCVFR
jgi:hypothetical protein